MTTRRLKIYAFTLFMFVIALALPTKSRATEVSELKEYNVHSSGGGVNFDASIVIQHYKDLLIIWDLNLSYERAEKTGSGGEAKIEKNFKDIATVRRAKPVEFMTPMIRQSPEWRDMLYRFEIVFKDGQKISVNQGFTGLNIDREGTELGTEGFVFDDFVPSADVYTFFELFPSKLHSFVHVLDLGEPFFHNYAIGFPSLHDRIYEVFHDRSLANPLGSKTTPICEGLLVIEGGKKDEKPQFRKTGGD